MRVTGCGNTGFSIVVSLFVPLNVPLNSKVPSPELALSGLQVAMPLWTSFSGPSGANVSGSTKLEAVAMDKADNQGKEAADGERDDMDDLSYLDRPMISYGPRTIPRPQSRVMVWLRRILGRQSE